MDIIHRSVPVYFFIYCRDPGRSANIVKFTGRGTFGEFFVPARNVNFRFGAGSFRKYAFTSLPVITVGDCQVLITLGQRMKLVERSVGGNLGLRAVPVPGGNATHRMGLCLDLPPQRVR